MIVSMKLHATREQIDAVCERVRDFKYKIHTIEGEERCVIGIVGVGDSTCSSAPASLRLAARRSSARGSNNPVCSGPSAEQTPSSLCAAPTSTVVSRTIGSLAGRRDFHFCVAHP